MYALYVYFEEGDFFFFFFLRYPVYILWSLLGMVRNVAFTFPSSADIQTPSFMLFDL